MQTKPHNWAGNIAFGATEVHYPRTVEEVQALVAQHSRLKVLGAGHSFTPLADTTDALVSLKQFDPTITVDAERSTVTIGGGVRYYQLVGELHQAGYALHNLPSLPDITVAGACATGTHGSGDANGCIATSVAAIEFVAGTGDVVTLTREEHGEQLRGVAVNLGGIGIVTRLTLDVQPTFTMRQDVYQNLPLDQVLEHVDAIFADAYSVSLFCNWSRPFINQAWVKRRIPAGGTIDAPPQWFEAMRLNRQVDPVGIADADLCTEQLGHPGPWHERLPHFRLGYMAESGEELQTEYMVPRQHAVAALEVLDRLRNEIAPRVFMGELRTIAGDELWMSPFYQQPSIALHFTWKPDEPAVREVLPMLEAELAPLGARPHWGKLFSLSPEHVRSLYPHLADFQALLKHYDPEGKFRNQFLDTYVGIEN